VVAFHATGESDREISETAYRTNSAIYPTITGCPIRHNAIYATTCHSTQTDFQLHMLLTLAVGFARCMDGRG
jgi:hypothetical protein